MNAMKLCFAATLAAVAMSGAQAAQDTRWHIEGSISDIAAYSTSWVDRSTDWMAFQIGMHVGDRFTIDIGLDLAANKGTSFAFTSGSYVYREFIDPIRQFNGEPPSPSVYERFSAVHILGDSVYETLIQASPRSSDGTHKGLDIRMSVAGLQGNPSFADANAILSKGNASVLSGDAIWSGSPADMHPLATLKLNYDKVAVTAVPEPSALAMFAWSVAGLAAVSRLRRKPASQ